jgi:glycolate oxidase iron-sulfur subunit
MQTSLADFIRDTAAGREADAILRSCVHCGFCTATCPTYQLLGDELDGPRGRIYLIKQALEGREIGSHTLTHLDRCLTCRSCETTCPSGVRYGRLVDIGREVVEHRVGRPWTTRLVRRALRLTVPFPRRFGPLLRVGNWFRPLLPGAVRRKVPQCEPARPWPSARHQRTMLALDGCVQSAATPNTNAAAARLLDRLGISLISADGAGCCGAVSHHLSAPGEALDFARRNVDAWWPYIERGAEALVITASGCAAMVKEYGHLLAHDSDYADKAARVSDLTKDLGEILCAQDLGPWQSAGNGRSVAFHIPCTLQHALKAHTQVEDVLRRTGFQLTAVADAHLCCGSAGTYSILQPDLSHRLLENKVRNLEAGEPELVATANIGCLMHLRTGTRLPVKHWIELLDEACP